MPARPAPFPARASALAALWLAACAGSGGGADAMTEQRVLVKLSVAAGNPAPLPDTVAEWARQSADTPARYAAAVGPGWHALALQCRPADCDAALRRLSTDTVHFDAIEPDTRRRPMAPAAR